MLKLYVIRHAETEWNAQQRMQGWKDSSLTETGRKHATLLQERLRTVPFTALYCSPSDRTKETAQIVLGQRDVPMYFDERLREIHLGHWEGKTIAEIAQTDERNHYYFIMNHMHTIRSLEKRFLMCNVELSLPFSILLILIQKVIFLS